MAYNTNISSKIRAVVAVVRLVVCAILPASRKKAKCHINNRQAPNIKAAVPVQTPLYYPGDTN